MEGAALLGESIVQMHDKGKIINYLVQTIRTQAGDGRCRSSAMGRLLQITSTFRFPAGCPVLLRWKCRVPAEGLSEGTLRTITRPLCHLGYLSICGGKDVLGQTHPAFGEIAEGRATGSASESLGKPCPGHPSNRCHAFERPVPLRFAVKSAQHSGQTALACVIEQFGKLSLLCCEVVSHHFDQQYLHRGQAEGGKAVARSGLFFTERSDKRCGQTIEAAFVTRQVDDRWKCRKDRKGLRQARERHHSTQQYGCDRPPAPGNFHRAFITFQRGLWRSVLAPDLAHACARVHRFGRADPEFGAREGQQTRARLHDVNCAIRATHLAPPLQSHEQIGRPVHDKCAGSAQGKTRQGCTGWSQIGKKPAEQRR